MPRKVAYAFVEKNGLRWRCWVPDKEAKSGKRWFSCKPGGAPFVSALEAHKFAVRWRELRDEVERLPPRLRLREAVDQCLRERGSAVRPGTLEYYTAHLERFSSAVGDKLPLHRLDRATVKGWVLKLIDDKVNPTPPFRAVRMFVRWCLEEGFLDTDPLRGVTRVFPKVDPLEHERRQPFLTPKRVLECITLIRKTDAPDAVLMGDVVALIFGTGVRRHGVCNILVDEVDLEAGTIRCVDKGKVVVLHVNDPEVAAAVGRLLLDAKAAKRKTLLPDTPSALSHRFDRWRKRIGENHLLPHALKRAYVDHENSGMSLKDLQMLTRHCAATMALTYARADEARVRQATASMFERVRESG